MPQDTVLGPILFIINYINELLNVYLNTGVLCYADDSVVLVKNKD